MNHSFNSNIHKLCSICGRNEIDHSDIAQCEACSNVGQCEVIGTMLLCANCYDKERAIPSTPITGDERAERITQLTNLLGKEIPIDSRHYFVSEVTSIVDIERKLVDENIENPQYALAEIVSQRLFEFRKRLFLLKNEAIELRVDIDSDQKYLNQIVPRLREEEREKFKAYDISYKPNVVAAPVAASKPRTSASDKALESFAKMMNISLEQARVVMSGAMKNITGAKCTCAETPGCCRVHPK